MALKATIFKANVQISDLDRHYYGQHDLVIARHPSETDQRMLTRLIAFVLNAHPNLTFTKGLSTKEEPELWLKSDQGDIELWIELGQPDEKRLRKVIKQSRQVIVYDMDSPNFEKWWLSLSKTLGNPSNLSIYSIAEAPVAELAQSLERSNELQATIQDDQMWLSMGDVNVEIAPKRIQ
ncbi:YaeQ family protein [Litoribrevibacter albus]|uniref:YaeQ family protein n=1 Tax=Litoribrevibacter albus TaxID=1473156 RepID=A0AA37W754_9GAMM|nr:YaeQ family protein [Litoribrevibacter albus]GLQ30809.1 hypothetical protein GCM10007876_12880 [Litoribrevibacter albus]